MKTKGPWLLLAVLVFAVTPLVAELVAIDMNYWLQAQETGVSDAGYNTLGLPYDRDPGIGNYASTLRTHIGSNTVTSISRYDFKTDSLQTYAGILPGNDYEINLDDTEGYIIQIAHSSPPHGFEYNITGNHDTTTSITLYEKDEGGSAEGITDYSPPYWAHARTASALKSEIEAVTAGTVAEIARFKETDSSYQVFTGTAPDNVDFQMRPGESYRIKVNDTVTFTPKLMNEPCVLGDGAPAELANLDTLFSVKAWPAVPGCEVDNGFLDITNNSQLETYTVFVDVAYEVCCPGTSDCEVCGGNENDPFVYKEGCDRCNECNWCVTEEVEIAPLSTDPSVRGMMPHCNPSCDNRFCDGGDCDGKPCLRDTDCPDADPQEQCSDDGGLCPAGGTSQEDYHCIVFDSLDFAVAEFLCNQDEGDFQVRGYCETYETPCVADEDCPGDESCTLFVTDLVWGGTVVRSSVTSQSAYACPTSCPAECDDVCER